MLIPECFAANSYFFALSTGLEGGFCEEMRGDDCKADSCRALSLCETGLNLFACYCAPGFVGRFDPYYTF